MRDEFFGDINDFHKYGLLRLLTRRGQLRTGVCWMRRPDEGSAGGYLNKAPRRQKYDNDLYESLRRILTPKRNIRQAERDEILPPTKFLFFRHYLSDDKKKRTCYFARALERFKSVKLIFFDPDTGLEVRSLPLGSKGSSRYLYRDEVCRACRDGKSVLIYQHFPPKPRKPYIAEKQKEIKTCAGALEVHAFQTPRAAFFLAVQQRHSKFFRERIEEMKRSSWQRDGQIVVYSAKSDSR